MEKTVKIGGSNYKIIVVPKSNHELKDKELWGKVNHMHHEIFLADDLCKAETDITLLHEILHAMEAKLSIESSEEYINQMSIYLHQFIVDNPKVIKNILKES